MAADLMSDRKYMSCHVGDEVIVPVHVSKLINKSTLPWSQQWVPLRGIVTRRNMFPTGIQYEVEISANTEYQTDAFRLFAAPSHIQKYVPSKDSRGGEGIIERIISCRSHRHNSGIIPCQMYCDANRDYLIKWKDEEGPKSCSWETNLVLSSENVKFFEDREIYRIDRETLVKQYLLDMIGTIDPADKDQIKAALDVGIIERVKHDHKRYPDLCMNRKQFCFEKWDYLIWNKHQNLRLEGTKRLVVLSSVAPVENVFMKEMLKKLPPEASDVQFKPSFAASTTTQCSVQPSEKSRGQCRICLQSLLGVDQQAESICVKCTSVTHLECSKMLYSNPNERLCLECEASSCGICYTTNFNGGVGRCSTCKRNYCRTNCLNSVQTGIHTKTYCTTCYTIFQRSKGRSNPEGEDIADDYQDFEYVRAEMRLNPVRDNIIYEDKAEQTSRKRKRNV